MKIKLTIGLPLLALLISGCSVKNAFTGGSEISSMTIGAAACGAAGALIGGLVGQRLSTAAIGGAAGAALCGGVGYYLDHQEAKLRKKLEQTGVSVIREGDSIRLVMPGHIAFDSDLDNVKMSFYPVLKSIKSVLQEYTATGIEILGHTDSIGSERYNFELSKRRASNVANYLVFLGVTPNRIITKGLGERYPIAGNKTAGNRSLNRRVELIIISRK